MRFVVVMRLDLGLVKVFNRYWILICVIRLNAQRDLQFEIPAALKYTGLSEKLKC